MRQSPCAVYILTNRRDGVLYTGVTNDLRRRLEEHRTHRDDASFATRYKCARLVYFETTDNIAAAIEREKQIKGWLRRKKIALIEAGNPEWRDLSEDWDP